MKLLRLLGLLLMPTLIASWATVPGTASTSVGSDKPRASSKGRQVYPNAPTDLRITDASQQTSLTASWSAVTGASGYRIGRNGIAIGDTSRTTYTWTDLQCGTTYSLSVQPEKSVKDTRGRFAIISQATASCSASANGDNGSAGGANPPPAPAFIVTSSITNGSTSSGTVTWTATVTGGPVAKVEFLIDGVSGWTATVSPYRFNGDPSGVLDTTALSNGPHTLAVRAHAVDGRTAIAQSVTTVDNEVSSGTTDAVSSGSAGSGDSGVVVFKDNFERGNISQWQSTSIGGAQCGNYGVASDSTITRGNFYLSQDIAAGGRYGGQFDLPAAANNNACELLRGRTAGLDEEWYALEVRFPDSWREPSPAGWGLTLAQFNYEGIWGAPLGVAAHGNYVDLILNSGLCKDIRSGHPSCPYTSGIGGNVPRQYLIPPSDFSTGVWHQFLIHVKWSNDNDGIVEGFHRLRGQTSWAQTASLRGYPTLQRTVTFTPTASSVTVDKIGAYRGPASFPLSIWHDNFCQATTMAAAETCF